MSAVVLDSQQTMNLTLRLNLSFIPRARHAALQYSPVLLPPLPHTPQEMVPLSLGEEVARRRPQAYCIDGRSGKLLIITYKWQTRRHCSAGCPLRNVSEQWTIELQRTTCAMVDHLV